MNSDSDSADSRLVLEVVSGFGVTPGLLVAPKEAATAAFIEPETKAALVRKRSIFLSNRFFGGKEKVVQTHN